MTVELHDISHERIKNILIDIDLRIGECRLAIANSKINLTITGKPTTSGNYIRTRETRDMYILGLVRDLLKCINIARLSPMGENGLDRLVYPIRRHNRDGIYED